MDTIKPKPLNLVLSRLKGTTLLQRDEWQAYCPLCGGAYPTLLVKEIQDGAILLYCFRQCSPIEIIESTGLSPDELIPDKVRIDCNKPALNLKKRFTSAAILKSSLNELMLAVKICERVADDSVTGEELDEVNRIKEHFLNALKVSGVNRVA